MLNSGKKFSDSRDKKNSNSRVRKKNSERNKKLNGRSLMSVQLTLQDIRAKD
jgi:hypothetical protein